MTHPLIRNAAGEILVKTELEVHSRVERPGGFSDQPTPPVRVLLSNLLDLRASAPARAVIVPDDLDLADLAERAGLDEIAHRYLIWLAAVLSADLRNAIVFNYGVASGPGFFQVIGHGFFAVAILASLDY